MPINRKKMAALRKSYGAKGEDIYYALEQKAKQKAKAKRKGKK